MAPPTLTPQIISLAGVVLAFQPAAGMGETVACSSSLFIVVVNGGGSPITVTLNRPPGAYEPNVAITSPAVSVTNGTTKWIGPIDPSFVDPSLGDPGTFIAAASRGTLGSVSYSSVASVTVAACRFRQPGDA